MKTNLLNVFFIIALLTCCKSQSDIVYVGAIMDLSSNNAEYGKNVQKGMELALKEYNKTHHKSKIQVIYEDNSGNATKTLNAYHQMSMQHNPIVVVDGAQSTLSLSLIPKLEKEKVVLLSTGSSSPKLTGISPYFFRLWNCDTEEGSFIAEQIFNTFGLKSINVVYLNTDYGVGLLSTFKSRFNDLGGNIASAVSFEDRQADFKDCVHKVKQTPADGIYIISYATEAALISKYIRSYDTKTPLFSTVATEADQFLKLAGKSGEGIIYAYTRQADSNAYNYFQEIYMGEYNEAPQILTDVAYDAMNILLEGIEKNGVNDGEMLKNFLSTMSEYDGASGNIKFDKDGNVHKGMILKTVQNGKFVDYAKNDERDY